MDESHWSADVPVSMPQPTSDPTAVAMQGFAFTESGMAHDITLAQYARLSTPDWQPRIMPSQTVYDDSDIDDPPSSTEVF